MARYDNGIHAEAEKIIQRCLEENRVLEVVPFLGPLLLQSGIDRASRITYVAILQKEKLTSLESLAATDATMLRAVGIPLVDAIRLLKTLKAQQLQLEPPSDTPHRKRVKRTV